VRAAKPKSVLEVACGTGILTRRLATVLDSDVKLTATDLHEAMLGHAKEALRDFAPITWRKADALALPFADGSFDAVVNQFGMMFVPDKEAAIREAHRVLTRNGVFAFNVWCSLEDNPFGRVAHATIARFFPDNPPAFYLIPFGWHDEKVIRGMLVENAFKDVKIEKVTFEATATSARELATGLVQGNPVVHAIQEAGLEFDTIVDAVAKELIRAGGDKPHRSPMNALVVTAKAA
jgi:ubiquinone/menaquinone biosynthesis C-methylase UbiE